MTDWLEGKKKYCYVTDILDKMARDEIDTFLVENNIDIYGKKVLDVGMGRRYHFNYLMELCADVYGFDPYPLYNYTDLPNRAFNACVESISENLLGTFDIAIQFRYGSGATPSSIRTVAKALKPDGIYLITFASTGGFYINSEGKYTSESEEYKTLCECFCKIEISKPLFPHRPSSAQCIASEPRILDKKKGKESSLSMKRKNFQAELRDFAPLTNTATTNIFSTKEPHLTTDSERHL